nr:MAG TPA: hypothetical protein [Bacteriophage sp.]
MANVVLRLLLWVRSGLHVIQPYLIMCFCVVVILLI